MNVLKEATKEKLAEYLKMRKNKKIKSPNVAVSGLTGDGNVTTTPPKLNKLGRAPFDPKKIDFSKGYDIPDEENQGGFSVGFLG